MLGEVERLRELLSKATPGEWSANGSEVLPENSCGEVQCCGIADCYHGSRTEVAQANADAIASAINFLRSAAFEEMVRDAGRAAYWKQRAKAAEGHLWGADMEVAAKAVHRIAALHDTPWEQLTDQQRWGFSYAAMQAVAAINDCRDARKPNDTAMSAEGANG
jgi:hypothetical protein